MHEMNLRVQVLQPAGMWSRAIGRRGINKNVGVSLRERRAIMQVMLGVSLRARWDATLVIIIIIMGILLHAISPKRT